MNKRVAVIDLGTNTFHLLIAEGTLHDFREIVHYHEPVKLGEGGINKGHIIPEAFARGLNTMRNFQEQIDAHHVQQVRAVATSALRSASNGKNFIDEVKSKTGIGIEIINGEQEAGFIYEGVKISACLSARNALIIDIGGGSIEFIVGNKDNIIWKQSFEIGAARLMDLFHRTDPIPPASIEVLERYLEDNLTDLFVAIKDKRVDTLIGSSGAFETFAELAENGKGHSFDLKATKNYSFEYGELLTQTSKLVRSSHQQRAGNKSIIPVRVDMIVVAALITRFIILKLDINKVLMCSYSLKEGVLAGMLD